MGRSSKHAQEAPACRRPRSNSRPCAHPPRKAYVARRMRRTAFITVAALAAALAAVPTANASRADRLHGRCDPAHHLIHIAHGTITGLHTIRQTKRVWIATTARDFGAEFFACWKPTHQARRIVANTGGAAVTDEIAGEFAVSGRYVAFHVAASGDETFDRFESFDVSTLRLRRDTGDLPATATTTGMPATPTVVAVTSTGALGWLASGTLGATDAAGTRVLAQSTGGPIDGLASRGGTVSWNQNGRRASAALK